MPLPDDTKAITGMLKNVRDSARRVDARTLRVRTEPKQRSGANLQHKEQGGAIAQDEIKASTPSSSDEPSTLDDTASPEIAPARWKNLDDAAGSVAPADAFKGWFGASQVRDDEGRPQRLFHGTVADQDFDQFDRGHATVAHAGKGFYFAENPKIADTFAAGEGGRTLPTYLSIKKPFDFDGTVSKEEIERWKTALKDRQAQDLDHVLKGGSLRTDLMGRLTDLIGGLFRSSSGNVSGLQAWKALGNVVGASQVNATLKDLGYDGIKHTAMGLHGGIRPPGSDAPNLGRVFVAFEPTQIKSATGNEGTYDPNDPRIHKERGGAITPPTPASQPSRIHRPSAEPVTPVASFTPWSTLKRGWKTGKAAAGSVSALLNVPGMDTGQVAAGVLAALVGMNQGAGTAAAMPGTHVIAKPITKDAALTAADAFGQMRRPEDEHPEPSQLRRPQIHREEGGPVLSRMRYLTTAQPDPSAKLQQLGGEVPEVPGLPRQADEVPIKAQAGEVMVKNGPAQVYRQQLDAMNNDQVPHFNQGGVVGQSQRPSQLRRPASNNEKATLRMQREAEEQAAKFEGMGVSSEAAWYRRQAEIHAKEVARLRALPVASVAPTQPSQLRRPAAHSTAPVSPSPGPSTLATPPADGAPSSQAPTPGPDATVPADRPSNDDYLLHSWKSQEAARLHDWRAAEARRNLDVAKWRTHREKAADFRTMAKNLADAPNADDGVPTALPAEYPSTIRKSKQWDYSHGPLAANLIAKGIHSVFPGAFGDRAPMIQKDTDAEDRFSGNNGGGSGRNAIGNDELLTAIEEMTKELKELKLAMKDGKKGHDEPGIKKDGSFVPIGPKPAPGRRGMGGFAENPITPGNLAAAAARARG